MIKKIISLIVPHYIILSLLTIFLANFFINQNLPNFDMLIGGLVLAVSIIAFNMFNMTQDIKLDSYEKNNRPLVKGEINRGLIMKVSIFLYVLSVGAIILNQSNLEKYWPILIYIIFSVAYTLRPLYLKKYLFASNIFGAVLYAMVPILLVFSTSDTIDYFYLYFFSIIMFFIATTKEFEDLGTEKKSKYKNLTIVFGINKTKKIVIWGINLFLLICLILCAINLINRNLLLPLLASLVLTNTFLKKTLDKPIEKNITSQSSLVTYSMAYFVMVQLLFCLNQLFLVVF